MNNATLEHLLQIATPPRDAGPSATRTRGDAPPFDSLFRQASEPPSRNDRGPDPSPASTLTTRESRLNNPPAKLHEKSAAPQDSASSTDAEFVASDTAAQEEHQEPERDELISAEAVAVAAVAVKETAPATELTPQLAIVEEVEQAVDVAIEPSADSQPKSDAKTSPVAESLAETPKTTASAQESPTKDSPVTKEAALVTAVATGDVEDVSTPQVQVTTPTDATTPAIHESKGKARTASKTRETAATADSTEIAKPAAEHATDQADPTAAGNEAAADAGPALDATTEAAPQTTEAKPSIVRAEVRNDEQTAGANSNSDQAPAPVRPAAAASVPIAANIQQQTQAAGTTANANAANTIDTTTKTDAARTQDAALSPFARLERNQTGTSRGASGAGHSQSSRHVDPARFVSRVARAIHTAQERGAPLQLRLSPPELGAMRIELSVNQGNLTATIETDNSSARQVLLENLPALRERLAEQNVKIERFDVDVRRDGSGQQNPATQQQNDQPQQERAATRSQSLRGAANQTTGDEPPTVRRTITASSINVIA